MIKVMKNNHGMRGKLIPKRLGPYTILEFKESGGYIVKDKYSEEMKEVIPNISIYIWMEKVNYVVKNKNGR